jgi:hypothetical protein
MSESDHLKMATIARNLARALLTLARKRRDDDRKRIAELQTELCALYRDEQAHAAHDEGTPA